MKKMDVAKALIIQAVQQGHTTPEAIQRAMVGQYTIDGREIVKHEQDNEAGFGDGCRSGDGEE